MASDSHQSTVSMESAAPKRSSSPSRKRRRIFHTCAVSMLATADRASSKATTFNGPFGLLVNRVVGFVTMRGPFAGLYRFQTHLLLFILAFVDDRVLKVEDIVEDHFPSSGCVFDKIDNVVCFTESLPEKIDSAADKVSEVVNQLPPLSIGVTKILDLVSLLFSQFRAWWRSEHVNSTKERDIMVDTNFDKNRHGKIKRIVCDEAVCQIELNTTSLPQKFRKSGQRGDRTTVEDPESLTVDEKREMKEEPDMRTCDEIRAKNTEESMPKCSYKEVLKKGSSFKEIAEKGCSYKDVLEKGTKEESKEQLDGAAGAKDCHSEINLKQVKNVNNKQVENSCTRDNFVQGNEDGMGINGGNDPILELFESAWHMT